MSSGRVLLGVTASVAGSLGHSLGMTLQKRAHLRLESQISNAKAWKDPQWQFGLALYLFSSTVPPTIALSMLPVFVTAPLAAVGLVANAVFAKYILASSFARTDALGTILVSVGSCCVAAFGAIDEPPLSLEDLLLLYKRPAYVMYFVIYSLIVATLIVSELYWRRKHSSAAASGDKDASSSMVVSDAVESRVALQSVPAALRSAWTMQHGVSEEETLLGGSCPSSPRLDSNSYASTSVSPAIESSEVVDQMYRHHFSRTNEESMLMLPNEIKMSRSEQVARYISGFLSAVISGLICSQTLLLAKSGIGLLVLTFQGHMQFNDPLALAIVIGLIVTALANLYYIQHALRLCSTLTVVPLCYCSSSLSALISSLVYFNQMRLLSHTQVAMISVGVVLLASGVALLSSKADCEDGPLQLPDEPTE
ncbi:hypothetical protein LPJ66_000084 [Kickxella alabastrina]|uniref:Uncharacterized protein n=1 Tax=Kickxella alabastrina TaxID=61397 RepID=A0ACC1IWV9_9FUNG|nr:hypothetical protein LPJ66_000084 [Kickxella alabastrina]